MPGHVDATTGHVWRPDMCRAERVDGRRPGHRAGHGASGPWGLATRRDFAPQPVGASATREDLPSGTPEADAGVFISYSREGLRFVGFDEALADCNIDALIDRADISAFEG